MDAIGVKRWLFAAGHIPLLSKGAEPMFTSHDKIAVLNTTERDASIKLTIYYQHTSPVTDYELIVKAHRVRKIRLNDIIDPLPIPLDEPYGFLLESDTPVVVQFSRMMTARAEAAGFVVTPYAVRNG